MATKTYGQCGRTICRYNIHGECCSEHDYEVCTTVCKEVLGKRYEDFLEYEKERIERGAK